MQREQNFHLTAISGNSSSFASMPSNFSMIRQKAILNPAMAGHDSLGMSVVNALVLAGACAELASEAGY
jgi:hypothetical protein